jgi:hypothetical protein
MKQAGATAFDPIVAAQVSAQVTLDAILAPEQLARLADQHRRDPAVPGPGVIADRLLALANAPVRDPRLRAIRRAAATRILMSMAKAVRNPATGTLASSRLDQALADWAGAQSGRRFDDPDDRAWALSTSRLLLDREALETALRDETAEVRIPPGMPIGTEDHF